MSSLPLRYSIALISTSSPLISLKAPLTALPSSLTPLTMTWKLCPGYGSFADDGGHGALLADGQAVTVSSVFCWMRKITNSAGLTGAMPISQIRRPLSMSSWAHGRAVADDVEGLVGGRALQRADPPLGDQEAADRLPDPRPQRLVVRLEDHPLRGLVDRLLDHEEQATHADVAPRRRPR